MNYKSQILISFEENPNLIKERLNKWAKRYKFKEEKALDDKSSDYSWTYKRGSHFRGSCSFDVRCVPTTVIVEFNEIKQSLTCLFHVKSFFYRQMASDAFRVDEQLESLITYLRGVFNENLSFRE